MAEFDKRVGGCKSGQTLRSLRAKFIEDGYVHPLNMADMVIDISSDVSTEFDIDIKL